MHLFLQIEYLYLSFLITPFASILVITKIRLPALESDRRLLLFINGINVHLYHEFFGGLL